MHILTKLFFWQNNNIISHFISFCQIYAQNTIFLILLNVKIPSPLARVKMKRDELFSKNGDSTRIF